MEKETSQKNQPETKDSDKKTGYYPEAKIKCGCGNVMTVGSTVPEMEIEICSACHPYYTGQKKILDTAGRVERFKDRLAKAQARQNKTKKR